ncbi:hypothetical protein [Amycolatopsis nigrescens]|uniref:hypothetical protein n=1 Tax=Amycolatopsis nigrescens TaxID=381445 RepID=UPI0012F8BAFC|nr:hypothetical protein [Amycolatopsis nigrescens]
MSNDSLPVTSTFSLPKPVEVAAAAAGAKFERNTEEVLLFKVDRTQAAYFRRYHLIPIEQIGTLESQATSDVQRIPDYFGFISPKQGYFEVAIEHARRGRIIIPPILSTLKCGLSATCRHSDDNPIPTVSFPQAKRGDEERPGRRDQDIIPIHLTDDTGGTCIEISTVSPLGVLFALPNSRGRIDAHLAEDIALSISIKIDFGSEMSDQLLLDKGIEKANSLLYELNVRNDQPFRMIGTALYERESRKQNRQRLPEVRFPTTSLPHEVAELFSSAETARDNPVIAFLSFYQVLEYYFPYAIRKDSIRKVRREIVDPWFSISDDDSIMRILSTVENSVNAPESTQIATLLTHSVRETTLIDFFSKDEAATHFSRSGPISGVEWINTKNANRSIAAQVAERIYKIRNRIVHAKDDPKYSDVRVLLPNSREAYALQPDIDLVRLLAIEVVTDSQVERRG